MEPVLKELSLYDLTGYLLPGVIVVWSCVHVMNAYRARRNKDHIGLNAVTLIASGYITGHMLQTIATFLLENRYTRHFLWQNPEELYAGDSVLLDGLKSAIWKTFGCITQDKRFILCQTFVQARGLDAYTDIMQARYAFFKGLTLALLIACLAFYWYARHLGKKQLRYVRHRNMAILLLVAMLLSLWRLHDFGYLYTDSVYRTFYVATLPSPTATPTPTQTQTPSPAPTPEPCPKT